MGVAGVSGASLDIIVDFFGQKIGLPTTVSEAIVGVIITLAGLYMHQSNPSTTTNPQPAA